MANDKIAVAMKALSQAMPGALAEFVRQAPLSPGKVEFAWRAVVGPALQRATAVRLEGTTLLLDAASPQWTLEIRRLTPVILPRLQALLGAGTVTAINVRT